MYVVRFHRKRSYKGKIILRTSSLTEARSIAATALGVAHLSKKRLIEEYPNGGGYWSYCTPYEVKLWKKPFHTGGVSIRKED